MTLSTADQSTAARSEPAGAFVAAAHSWTRAGGEIEAEDLAVQFGEPFADVSADGAEAEYQMHACSPRWSGVQGPPVSFHSGPLPLS
ncbi:hypothetical protein TNCT6_60270 [Streptomyces sp. 6-11-2]|nr:hypothetical protein TNCT6_60270 [Streptomyces sp. 6-11-2]